MKYIIDTDIGDDIDDAFALLFAMEQRLDIIGITTVFKNTAERAKIAKKLMMLYGNGYENTPVFAGYGNGGSGHLWQYTEDLKEEIYTPNSKNPDDAIDFIINSCKKYGKDLTVIAIGPFTNIAKVIEKEPNALNNIGKVIIMGGAYFKQYADWNVISDPESAKLIFEKVNNIKCIGADVTHLTKLAKRDDKAITEYKGTKAKEYVSFLYSLWKRASGAKTGVLHDPLAIYYAINDDICQFENSKVFVITEGPARGMTLNLNAYGKSYLNEFYKDNKNNPTHSLAKKVDKKRLKEDFVSIFK